LKKVFILFIILFLPSLIYLFFSTGRHNFIHLPIYGEREGVNTYTDSAGKTHTDTIYHTIPPFKFTSQDGRVITDKTFEGKIYVANFFFATCQSICPKMNTGMLHVQERFKDYKGLMFLSHTVDPIHDSVPVLAEYAKKIHADTSNWFFVTGDKKEIYELGVHSYLLPVGEDALAEGGFMHSQNLVLVDKEKRIRGMYDGTSVKALENLIDDIKTLVAEYETHNRDRNKVTVGHP
jgi:protein SCO1/2